MTESSSRPPIKPLTDCPCDCGRRVRPGHLMCGTCWGRVPHTLQDAVNTTWRKYVAARPAVLGADDALARNTARRDARLAYAAARDAAIAAATGLPS